MAFEQRENSGSLFKNQKRTSETHAHATGSALINGVEYWVNAWTKEGKSGKWQSLQFKPKEKQVARNPERQPRAAFPGDDVPEDLIPF